MVNEEHDTEPQVKAQCCAAHFPSPVSGYHVVNFPQPFTAGTRHRKQNGLNLTSGDRQLP